MNKLQKQLRPYKNVVVSGTIISTVILGSLFGLLPAARKVVTLIEEVQVLKKQTDDLQTKISILESIDEFTYKQHLASLVTAVPADQSLTSLFSTIDGLSLETGVSVTDLSLTKPGPLATASARRQTTEEKQIGSNLLPFTVTISGNYDQIKVFLARAVQVRRFFRVRSFDLTLLDPTKVSVRMAMDAFYAPYLTAIGSVDTPIEALTANDEAVISTVSNMAILGNPAFALPTSELEVAPFAEPKANPFEP